MAKKKSTAEDSFVTAAESGGRFAYDGLERVLHEKARLGMLTSLVAHPQGLAFNDLKELCALTDGNLNRHLKVLTESGMIEVRKGFLRNRPHTLCVLTPRGRQRFLEYIEVLEQVVRDAAQAASVSAPLAAKARPTTA